MFRSCISCWCYSCYCALALLILGIPQGDQFPRICPVFRARALVDLSLTVLHRSSFQYTIRDLTFYRFWIDCLTNFDKFSTLKIEKPIKTLKFLNSTQSFISATTLDQKQSFYGSAKVEKSSNIDFQALWRLTLSDVHVGHLFCSMLDKSLIHLSSNFRKFRSPSARVSLGLWELLYFSISKRLFWNIFFCDALFTGFELFLIDCLWIFEHQIKNQRQRHWSFWMLLQSLILPTPLNQKQCFHGRVENH